MNPWFVWAPPSAWRRPAGDEVAHPAGLTARAIGLKWPNRMKQNSNFVLLFYLADAPTAW